MDGRETTLAPPRRLPPPPPPRRPPVEGSAAWRAERIAAGSVPVEASRRPVPGPRPRTSFRRWRRGVAGALFVGVWILRGLYVFGVFDDRTVSMPLQSSHSVITDDTPANTSGYVTTRYRGVPPAAVERAFADPYRYDLSYAVVPPDVERAVRDNTNALLGTSSALDSIRVRGVVRDGRPVATVLIARIDSAFVEGLRARGPFFLGDAAVVPMTTSGAKGGFPSFGIKPAADRRRVIVLNGLFFDIAGTRPGAVDDLAALLGFANM